MTSPPTHYEPHPHLVWPTSAKNRYLNSRLVILHASELATELFDELHAESNMHVYDVDIATAKLTKRGRITCMLLRNKTKWRLTFS